MHTANIDYAATHGYCNQIFFYIEQRISNSMYSPKAEASIKDLEIKENKAMVHTEMSYKENSVLRLLLKEVIKTISSGKSLTKKKKI